MSSAIITGSAGLVGSAAARYFAGRGLEIHGIDNDLRSEFFGPEASTTAVRDRLIRSLGPGYRHHSKDIRDAEFVDRLVGDLGGALSLVIHAASQPSHDWAARQPVTDFTVNANGTLHLLEAVRRHAPEAVFIFLSTNKVYGDRVNGFEFVEQETRWELERDHQYAGGIREDLPIDKSLHSLMGVSKAAADLMVQEYGRYFGLRTACFRAGCLTGPGHAGAELHGFLAYLMKCAVTGTPYRILGYKGKQVRDNILADDLVKALDAFFEAPSSAAVYNIGGGRFSNCSILEALTLCEEITGREVETRYSPENRIGDHIWWISDNGSFQSDYPQWRPEHDVAAILRRIHDRNAERWRGA